MPTFPIIPVDVFRGNGYDNFWSMLVSHYQQRPGVSIGEDTITEPAMNGSVLQYRRIDDEQAITWQMTSTVVSTAV
jgi:hypothetical protein